MEWRRARASDSSRFASAAASFLGVGGIAGIAGGDDDVNAALGRMSKLEMYQVMSEMKGMVAHNKSQARELLVNNPQLCRALFQAQVMLGMVGGNNENVLNEAVAIEQSEMGQQYAGGLGGMAPPPPHGMVAAPMPAPPQHQQHHSAPVPQRHYHQQQPQQYMGGGGHHPMQQQHHAGNAPMQPQHYSMPAQHMQQPPAHHMQQQAPPQMMQPQHQQQPPPQQQVMDAAQQQALIQQVMNMSQEQIASLPEEQRAQVLAILQQLQQMQGGM